MSRPSPGQTAELHVNLGEGRGPCRTPAHWVSADVHVHMNYGGEYRNTPAHLVMQAQAENLGIVNSLIVNKEQRFPGHRLQRRAARSGFTDPRR